MATSKITSSWLIQAILIAQVVAHAATLAQEPPKQSNEHSVAIDTLIHLQEGELPILISAPHGGQKGIDGVQPRKGEGMEKGPKGFFTGRDGGTEELALELSRIVESKFGKKPYYVVSSVHRKYLDPNRPPEIAFEDESVKPVYDNYHQSLAKFVREILQKHNTGLLLDIHGQGTSKETVYRGTSNGLTVERLRIRFGEGAHTGNESFFGMLKKQGWKVFPDPFEQKEQSGFTGGYIVRTYGSHQSVGIDAIQLEMGADYRSKENRAKVANQLTDALLEYSKLYLQQKP